MQRHRNPANGYRSNPMGIGGGVGQGYRNYNRGGGGGFGRGQPPQPRRIDVFMEAGKLASEYLFAKGLIPPSSGSGKWQMKNQIGGGEGEGSGVKRKLSDDFGSEMGGGDGDRVVRRSVGSVKDPRLEKAKGALEKQGDGDSGSGSMEEQRSGKDGAGLEEKSVSGDLELKSYDAGKMETTTVDQMDQSPEENSRVKTPVLDILPQESVEFEEPRVGKKVDMSTDDVIMDDAKQESEETVVVKEDEPEENGNDTGNENSSDLLTLIRSDKVPTRTRSSVTLKGSKSDPVLICGDENKNKSPDSGVPDNPISLQENQGLIKEPKIEETVSEQDQKYKFGQGLHLRSQSFPQRYSISEQDLNEIQHGYSRSSSDVLSRVEKQPLQINDIAELTKKPQEWTSANPHSNDYLHLSNSRGDQSSQVGGSIKTEPCNDFAEEKQLFPNSFKICDLNLMGASDANEHRDTKSVMGFSSIGQTKQEPVSVDFDLTMNSSYGIADRHFRRGPDGKGVEIIDLDCDSVQDDNNNPERRDEAIFTDLGSFPDSMQRVSDMPQDGYGLMISELLEADIPNSTVSSDVNPMHNEMSLQNEDGILADDESIYMSLGEIPISFVPVWDQQPSQGYNKRY